jgi:hypothetical protein
MMIPSEPATENNLLASAEKSGITLAGTFLSMNKQEELDFTETPKPARKRQLPSISYLRRVLKVCPESPTGLRWRLAMRNNSIPAYSVAGNLHFDARQNRYDIQIGIGRQNFRACRIIWAIHHGTDPFPLEVDHIDRDPRNNSVENLRLATGQQNCRNQDKRTTNKSGVKGVHFNRQTGRFRASIMVNWRKFNLGEYLTLEEAAAARKAAEIKYFGEFNPRPA